MVVGQSLLAGFSSVGLFSIPLTQTRHRFNAVVISAIAVEAAGAAGCDYRTAHAGIMALPDELSDLLETPDGWAAVVMIAVDNYDFRPVVH